MVALGSMMAMRVVVAAKCVEVLKQACWVGSFPLEDGPSCCWRHGLQGGCW